MKTPVLLLLMGSFNLFLTDDLIAQTNYRDSLLQELTTEKDAETRIWLKLSLAREYDMRDTSLQIANEIMAESQAIGFLKGEAFAHEIRSYAYYNMDRMAESLIEDSMHILVQQQLGNTFAVGAIHHNMGATYTTMRKLDQAIVHLLKAVEVLKAEESYDWLARVYNDLGEAFDLSEQPEQALFYLREGLALRKKHIDPSEWHYAYTDLGNFFSTNDQLDSALFYHQLALESAQLGEDDASAAIAYQNMGNALLIAGKNEAAVPYLLKANTYFEDTDRIQYLAPNYNAIGETYLNLGRYTEAIDYLNRSLEMTRENGPLNLAQDAHGILARLFEQQNDYQQAYFHLQQQKILQDSLLQEQNLEVIAGLERKYQNEQQKAQLAEQALELNRQSRLRNYTLLGAALFALALTSIFQFVRSRQKSRVREAALEAQLERAEADKLRSLDQLKSTFFANISHEFRTPLTLILGPVQQALEGINRRLDVEVPEEVTMKTRYLQLIERSTQRLLLLVNQLLDLSRIDGGQLQLHLQQGDLLPLLRALVYSFESLAERQQIDYEISFPEQLPQAVFDRDKWEKILVNLLSNAFKFTPEGGRVTFQAEAKVEGLQMRIADSGPGIKAADLDRIFDRFYQVEGTEARGTGIGLALVQELVIMLDGQIKVESEEGKGTTFILLLPFLPEHFSQLDTAALEEDSTEAVPLALPGFPSPAASGAIAEGVDDEVPTVLIVEDNVDLRNYIAEQLGASYHIITAENGQVGLELAIENTPDLIVSDVMMPKMDGFELCETLKSDERTSHIPVILLTAKAGQDHKLAGLETGADEYLTKPFDGRELQLRVQNLIRQRAQLRERYSRTMVLQPSEVAVTSADEQFIQKVQAAIEANIDNEQFSVEDLADAVAFSRSQLHRKLKALTDQSPTVIIRNFRLQRAKSLLEQGGGTVSEIALAVGFGNFSYFSKTFKAAFGVLPSEVAP
ncbi:response regulator [Lewinella sp. LCG006]|uniref:response regulator n=1 Tax=Lewinella sp. LCG006 TaxID=3231911 RepID=UPI00346019C1